MTKMTLFHENEIPYEKLQKYGITQEMIQDLPVSVMIRLLSGKTTPLLPIRVEDGDRQVTNAMARICLKKTEDEIHVRFWPQWEAKHLADFTEEEQEALVNGNVIYAEVKEMGKCYVQYDPCLRQALSAPAQLIRDNLMEEIRELNINDEDAEKILAGAPVCLNEDFTIGIDLEHETGVRLSKGNEQAWKEEKKALNLPKYNFGFNGCWISDVDDSLHYVEEKDYDDEMWAQMKRAGQQKQAKETIKNSFKL